MQRWLAKYAALGVLTRQAIESMVPVALLKVEPHHRVLDLCAGQVDDTQALEALHAHGVSAPSGIVVASDVSPLRGQMLSRRCAARRCAATAGHVPRCAEDATAAARRPARSGRPLPRRLLRSDHLRRAVQRRRHRAQELGVAPVDARVRFGDASTTVTDSDARRGAPRPGGLLCYSTCSQPARNEAVVAELLTRCGGALEIVDSSAALPELRRADGLHTWTVMDDDLTKWPDADLTASSDLPPTSAAAGSRRCAPPATAAALSSSAACVCSLPRRHGRLLRRLAPKWRRPRPAGPGADGWSGGRKRAPAGARADMAGGGAGRGRGGHKATEPGRKTRHPPCQLRARRRCGSSSGCARARGRCCALLLLPAAAPPSSATSPQLQPLAAAAAGGGGSALRLLSQLPLRAARAAASTRARPGAAPPRRTRSASARSCSAPPTAASSSSSRRARRRRAPLARGRRRRAPTAARPLLGGCGPRTAARASLPARRPPRRRRAPRAPSAGRPRVPPRRDCARCARSWADAVGLSS